MKKQTGPAFVGFLAVQLLVGGAFAAAFVSLTPDNATKFREVVTGEVRVAPVNIELEKALVIESLYDDPEVVSDEELAAVLKQVQPRFSTVEMKPNHVEHALRTWHADAEFQDPAVVSGADMRDFLLDFGQFQMSWKKKLELQTVHPLLEDRPTGVYVRWGHDECASVHHDHTLACITEAGVPLNFPVRTPGRMNLTLRNMVEQALFDFDLDERETEWSAMAFGLWLAPTVKNWENGKHRHLDFDRIAERQMRGGKEYGVCGGTHRVYSLMVLLRLDDKYDILSDAMHNQVYAYLGTVRDILEVTQFEDGHWPYNWPDGQEAKDKPSEYDSYRDVIATGHHLEWLAIAPEDLHPPREMIRKAADWIIKDTTSKTPQEILSNYTFYSHVGNALSLWRKTRATAFWKSWEAEHPFVPEEPAQDTHETASVDSAAVKAATAGSAVDEAIPEPTVTGDAEVIPEAGASASPDSPVSN
jgi:hypothetical protein